MIICDYYVVRKGYFDIKSLYSARAQDPYFYWFGWSWRGYTAYICGILINIVGFVGAIGKPVPIGATYIYNVNFFAGIIVASLTYYLLCRFFPVPATSDHWHEVGDEIGRNLSVVYVDSEGYDEEHATGYEDKAKSEGIQERKIAANF